MKVSGDAYLEIRVKVSGEYVPGAPDTGPSYASGGEPGYADSVEDVDVEDLLDGTGETLLAGVDVKNPAVQVLIGNILKAVKGAAEDDLIEQGYLNAGPDPDDARDRRLDDARDEIRS